MSAPTLNAFSIERAQPAEKAYKLADGGGLFLLIQPNGSRLWPAPASNAPSGRMVRITRDGKAIARLVPETEVRRAEVAEAIERLKALREELGKAPLDEVLASIHEGHKY